MLRRISAALAVALVWFPVLASGADFTLSGKNTTITFVGTKPGGRHDGGFKSLSGTASLPNNDLTALKITLDIDMTTLYSDNPKLTNHLKSSDFFGVNSNPKSKFVSTKVEKAGDDYKVTGDLTMVGKTNALTFPAKLALEGGVLTLSGTFSIDKKQWGMTYGQGKIHDEVKLTVQVKAK